MIADLNDNSTHQMGSFPPSPAGPGRVQRRAGIDWTPCIALESPQQMFVFGKFQGCVYFKLLRHWLEVKGPKMERVLGEVGFVVASGPKGSRG